MFEKQIKQVEGVKSKHSQESPNIGNKSQFQIFCVTPIFKMYDENNVLQVFKVFDEEYLEKVVLDTENDEENVIDTHRIKSMSFGVKKPGMQFKGNYHINLTDDDVSRSLNYLYKKGSEEVRRFNKNDFVRKLSIDKNGILFLKSRILDGQRFQIAGGLEDMNVFGLEEFGINMVVPVLDRYSPLSYAIGDYVHRIVSKHGGYETCLRQCLNMCFIIQGMSLFRELGEDCVKCAKLRKKYLDVSMGPIADEQLTIAPPHWITMTDIFGPCYIYVPGHSMKTRHREIIDVKCYILVFVCPTTKLTNLQVIEAKTADGVVEGINRLGCEVGVPSFVLVDQDSSILKVLGEAEVKLKDLQLVLYKEKGIKLRTCPVSGHNMHGSVERKIKSVQECLEKMDVANMKLHATGLQTILKLIENDLNNLPLGYSFGRDSNNSPLLRLIFPNLLKIGRLNTRALDGPIRMPVGPGELMQKIEKGYSSFFKIWNTTMVPKLLKMYKWFDNKSHLQVGDIVWFKKTESELSNDWTLGKIVSITKSRDGFIRRAEVQYQNATENEPRVTDRAVRSLIRLYHLDYTTWLNDMNEVEELVKALKENDDDSDSVNYGDVLRSLKTRHGAVSGNDKLEREIDVKYRPAAKTAKSKLVKKCKGCCCVYHCSIIEHNPGALPVVVNGITYKQEHLFAGVVDKSWVSTEELEEDLCSRAELTDDKFLSLLCASRVDLEDGDGDLLAHIV